MCVCMQTHIILHTMYDLKDQRPELLAKKGTGVVLISCDEIRFSYDKLNSDIYVKSLIRASSTRRRKINKIDPRTTKGL